jgi:hypothetical protein
LYGVRPDDNLVVVPGVPAPLLIRKPQSSEDFAYQLMSPAIVRGVFHKEKWKGDYEAVDFSTDRTLKLR